MYQELFRIPFINRPVYGYGLMLVIGFLLAAQLAKFLAGRCRLNGDTFVNAGLLALISGVIGARVSHVIESLIANNGEFANNGKNAWDNFLGMLNVSSGGLTFYGGFLLATPILIAYALWKKVPLLRGMDIIAPCLMIGLAFGRIGCYMNGCCYGAECALPWGAAFPYGSNAFVEQYEHGEITVPDVLTDPYHPYDNHRPRLLTREVIASEIKRFESLSTAERIKDPIATPYLERLKRAQEAYPTLTPTLRAKPVQPTELYSAFNAFLIAGALLAYFSTNPAPGRIFALMLLMKGMSRFIMEMLRVEPAVWFKGSLDWSFSMGISAVLIAAGVLMFIACGKLARKV